MEIKIKTGYAAFTDCDGNEDRNQMARELSRIFAKIVEKVEYGQDYGMIIDINGNNVGKWEL